MDSRVQQEVAEREGLILGKRDEYFMKVYQK